MSHNELNFSVQSDASNTSLGGVRNALQSLHSKVGLLEKDRDAHSYAASRARQEHDEYKVEVEIELNKERMAAAQRERQLLEDVAAAEAEINLLKDKLRQATLEPLPPRRQPTVHEREFDLKAAEQMEYERSRIREAEHEIEKLAAERSVLENANSQLDSTIQRLLRSNEELLQMLRVVPRSSDNTNNPASARATAERKSNKQNSRIGGGGSSPSYSSSRQNNNYNNNNSNVAGGGGGGPLAQRPMRFKSPTPHRGNNYNNNPVGLNNGDYSIAPMILSARQASLQRETVSSSRHRPGSSNINKQQEFIDRLSNPKRACSRERAGTPPHCNAAACGTSKNTARRFLTQELRAHAYGVVPK